MVDRVWRIILGDRVPFDAGRNISLFGRGALYLYKILSSPCIVVVNLLLKMKIHIFHLLLFNELILLILLTIPYLSRPFTIITLKFYLL